MAAAPIQHSAGIDRFKAVLAFASACMTGTEKSVLEKAVQARLARGGGQGPAKFRALLSSIDAVIQTDSDTAVLNLLKTMQVQPNTYLYRREMYFAMQSTLQINETSDCKTLVDAIGEVQTPIRHIGRTFAKSSIGSTVQENVRIPSGSIFGRRQQPSSEHVFPHTQVTWPNTDPGH